MFHNILIVYKDKPYHSLIRNYARHRDDANIQRLMRVKEAHLDTLKTLKTLLNKTGIRCTFIPLAKRFLVKASAYSLIVTVGGDGTFLDVAHCIGTTPILGINSSPSYSEGFFAGLNRFDIGRPLLQLLEKLPEPLLLNRLQCSINGRPLRELALNDALVCHPEPGATSRYIIRLGRRGPVEEQKGSGVWVATGSGSTAAIHSAGGHVMPLTSKKIQFVARELYAVRKRYSLRKGIIAGGEGLSITSLMERGALCIDGPRVCYPFGYKALLQVKNAPYPLRVIGLSRTKYRKKRR
ncbi:MAG: NAD(+)/NADH kinase [Candidatus Omnitrophica bacterium]|nr:NAD(+)/NADH kinase [Candidatus Omnitrophota bacterium]